VKRVAVARGFVALAIAALFASHGSDAQTLSKARLQVQVVYLPAGGSRSDAVVLVQGPRQVLAVNVNPSTAHTIPNLEPGVYALSATSGELCTSTTVSAYLSAGQTTTAVVRLSPCRSATDCPPLRSVKTLATASSGRYRASAGENGMVQLCRPPAEAIQLRGSQNNRPVRALAFSADSRFLAGGTDDGAVNVWHVATGKPLFRFSQGHRIEVVQFSGDARYLASAGDDHNVKVWDLTLGRAVREGSVGGKIDALQFTPDASFVVVTSGNRQQFVPVRAASK
jgi:WD40 repeat protein